MPTPDLGVAGGLRLSLRGHAPERPSPRLVGAAGQRELLPGRPGPADLRRAVPLGDPGRSRRGLAPRLAAPAVAAGLGSGWVVLSQVIAWRIRRRLGERDRASKIRQLARHEAESLAQANALFAGDHYDLCVVEAWRALECRLRQALLARRHPAAAEDSHAVIRLASRRGLLKEPVLGLVAALQRHWEIALSTDPLPREAALEALGAVRYILSILPAAQARSPLGRAPHPAPEIAQAA